MPQVELGNPYACQETAAGPDRSASKTRLRRDLAQTLAWMGSELRPTEAVALRTLPFFDPRDLQHASPLDGESVSKVAGRALAPALAPILPAEGVMLLHGCRGVGLTHMIVGCAAALAAGGSFLGWQADRPRRVLVLSGVDGSCGMAARIDAALKALGAGPLPPNRLRLMSPDDHAGTNAPLDAVAGQKHLAALLGQAEAILIDDLAMHLHAARSASAPVDIGILRRLLLMIRRTAKPIVIAQHSGGRMRSRADREALMAADGLADVVLGLRRPSDWQPADGCRFELHVERTRHLAGAACRPREIRLMAREDGTPAWVCDPVDESARVRFSAMIGDGMPPKLAGQHLGLSRVTVWRWSRAIVAPEAPTALPETSSSQAGAISH